MILLDANLLVYAHVTAFVQHERARAWLDERLSGSLPIGFPWSTLIAFLRLVTNARIFERPEPIARAWHQVEVWLGSPMAWIPQPTERHREVLGRLLVSHGAHANHFPMPIRRRSPLSTAWCCAPAILISPASQAYAGTIL